MESRRILSQVYQGLEQRTPIEQLHFSLKGINIEILNLFTDIQKVVEDTNDSIEGKKQKIDEICQEYAQLFQNEFLQKSIVDIHEKHIINIISRINGEFSEIIAILQEAPFESNEALQEIWEKLQTEHFNKTHMLFWGILHILELRQSKKVSEISKIKKKVQGDMHSTLSEDEDTIETRETINSGSIYIFGQGIFDIEGNLLETEILMRTKDKKGNLVYPDHFLKQVEKAGYIDKLDWTILAISFLFITSNNQKGKFSINVNPITLQDIGFVSKIKTQLETYQINPENIIIEFLEYESVNDIEQTNKTLRELRELGIQIAIDDFPSGHNTLYEITQFETIDIIKVDGIFVMELFKTCFGCESASDCIKILESGLNIDENCLKKIDKIFDIESLVFALRFLKEMYPNVQFFAERIEDESVFLFLQKISSIIGFQGYYFEKPKLLFAGEKADKEKVKGSLPAGMHFEGFMEKHHLKEISTPIENPERKMLNAYLRSLESFQDGLLVIAEKMNRRDIFSDSVQPEIIEAIKQLLIFLGGDTLSFYFVDPEIITKKSISNDGDVVMTSVPFDTNTSKVSKELTNLFKLTRGISDVVKGLFPVSHTPIPGEGDDIVLKVNEHFYIGIDDSERAIDVSMNIQISSLALFAVQLQNILGEK